MGDDGSETTEEMRELVRPESSQTIELKDAEVDSTDNRANKLVFYTDGRKIQKSKDDSLKQISAHWNGGQLVTDERGPKGRKMSRTIELSSDGKQIYETWHIENRRADSQQSSVTFTTRHRQINDENSHSPTRAVSIHSRSPLPQKSRDRALAFQSQITSTLPLRAEPGKRIVSAGRTNRSDNSN